MTRRLWRGLRVPIAVGILVAVLYRLGTSELLDALGRIDARAVLLTFLFSVPATVFSAGRWVVVSQRLGVRMRLRTAVADYYQALFLNATLPSGVLGDVHRAVRHGKDNGDVGRGVRAVLLERTAGQVVVVAASLAVLGAGTSYLPVLGAYRMQLAVFAVLVAAIGAVAAVCVVRARRSPAERAGWQCSLAAFFADARTALLARDSWPGVLGLSVLALAGHLSLFLAAARVAGATAPLAVLVPPLLLALLVMALPVNIGGWGPREGVCALAFGVAGLGAAQGLAAAVVYGALALLSSLPGAGVLALRMVAARRSRREEVQLEEHVFAEWEDAGGRPQGLPHPDGAREPQAGHAVADHDGRDRHVEPVQHVRAQESGHGRAPALHHHPAQTALR
ncbi:hypothetical protein GCM10012287_05330 [Streptomyces daqingensis]|uniref:Flippase-like domain-containing protein n=1 Tax=Streptomyces daqingensis TaxID=1472640 RepID=A0ABQ2LU32_9ACTN|nr:hypothetical protein GCM10012287_05330 [Streptomyces daqingensis]